MRKDHARATAMRLHPASQNPVGSKAQEDPPLKAVPKAAAEDGSLVTEYGLLAVVAATIAGAVIAWASNGALTTLFNALLQQARSLVGA